MKLMFASDIHGSQYYCEKMKEAYIKEGASKLILLGDLLYHGPRNDLPKEYNPKAVIGILNSLKEDIICIRGNCDTEVDQMVLDFPIMSDYSMLYIDGKRMYITHGHIYNTSSPLKMQKGDYLIHGHTHVRAKENKGVYTYINPGSVSIPKENNPHSYMIYENGEFIFKEIDE